jgi:ribosomal 50S subunit-associated protein YjgA (DUF615 family)
MNEHKKANIIKHLNQAYENFEKLENTKSRLNAHGIMEIENFYLVYKDCDKHQVNQHVYEFNKEESEDIADYIIDKLNKKIEILEKELKETL